MLLVIVLLLNSALFVAIPASEFLVAMLSALATMKTMPAAMGNPCSDLIERLALLGIQHFLQFCRRIGDLRQFLRARSGKIGVLASQAGGIGLDLLLHGRMFGSGFQCFYKSLEGILLRCLDFQTVGQTVGEMLESFLAFLGPILFCFS